MLFLSTLLLGACASNTSSTGDTTENTATKDEALEIVTTFYPMYDFTKNIVGDEANVALLMPAGTEPHDYEPSAKDIANIQKADAFVYNNENMEMWVPSSRRNIYKWRCQCH